MGVMISDVVYFQCVVLLYLLLLILSQNGFRSSMLATYYWKSLLLLCGLFLRRTGSRLFTLRARRTA